jgi:alkylated DNA repair dioxygenase AlkB
VLFGEEAAPAGFKYRRDFIAEDEEAALLTHVAAVSFSNFEMHGVVARRRVAFFGLTYDAGRSDSPPSPPFLCALRETIADWAGVAPAAFAMALINEYAPGAPIGWHRDAPQYDIVAGVSLLSRCRMKFRPYEQPGTPAKAGRRRIATHEVELEPRSAYLLTGDARARFEHHIPPAERLRYSITFRTLRQ